MANVWEIMERNGGRSQFHGLGPPTPTELERFVDQWPAVAARIGITLEGAAVRVFEPGQTYYPKRADGIDFGPDFWRDKVDRHSRDAGATIDGGQVRSRFILDAADQARWPRQQMAPGYFAPRPTRAVEVVTQLLPRENVTVATIAIVDGAPIESLLPPKSC